MIYDSQIERTRDSVRELMVDCSMHTDIMCKTFFPEYFTIPFSPMHDEIFSLLDDPDKKQVVIAAPRNLGKTSIAASFLSKVLLFKQHMFSIVIGASEDTAIEQTENVKTMLLESKIANDLFPNLKTKNWAKDQWELSNGCKVLPRGAGQRIRGRKSGAHRPSLIFVDDVENDENVQSEDYRHKLKNWFNAAVKNCVQLYGEESQNYKIVVIGTVLHEDSLLNNLLEDPHWHSARLSICDSKLKTNWPEGISTERLKTIYKEYQQQGLVSSFWLEFGSTTEFKDDGKFDRNLFQYHTPEQINEVRESGGFVVIIADPARTANARSAKSAIVAVMIKTGVNEIYVLDIVNDYLDPDTCINTMLEMQSKFNAEFLAPELTGLEQYFMQPLKQKMVQRNIVSHIIELKPRAKKEARAATLLPLYRSKRVWHHPDICAELEHQELSYPNCKYWDILDCLAHVLPIIDAANDYMLENLSSDDRFELQNEDQFYEDLWESYEEPLKNWQVAG